MNKIVIYTAIFGGKDNLLEPDFIPDNCDFICFTDSSFHSPVWQIRSGEMYNNDPVRSARRYKILAHKFLPEYEHSIWIDGNFILRGDVNTLINKVLFKNPMAVYDHVKTIGDSRNTVQAEAEAIAILAKKGNFKDDPVIIHKQLNIYKDLGFKDDNGLISSGILFRRHNEKNVIKTMEDWWQELVKYSRRDQISFNYAAWKNHLDFIYIQENIRDNLFFNMKQHKK